MAFLNKIGEAFDNGRLSDTSVTNEDCVVFLSTAKYPDDGVKFLLPSDQRINLTLLYLLIQVYAVLCEDAAINLLGLLLLLASVETSKTVHNCVHDVT